MTTSPDLEALKALVAAIKEANVHVTVIDVNGIDRPIYQVHYENALVAAARAAESALERLLAGQQEPVAWMYTRKEDSNNKLLGPVLKTVRETDATGWTETPLFAAPPVQEAARDGKFIHASTDAADARPLNLRWMRHDGRGEYHIEWCAPCGCAYHPEPKPHVHPCIKHSEIDPCPEK